MKRIAQCAFAMILVGLAVSCGGNSTQDNSGTVVYLTIEVDNFNPNIAICGNLSDITIESMSITSSPKYPGTTLSTNQDVQLTRWVVTPQRADGGTVASPVWSYDHGVFVPAGGNASLENYPVYGGELLDEPPLSYLFPENGGVDPETGNDNIRQTFNLQIFGRTVSGKAIATNVQPIAFNFTCN